MPRLFFRAHHRSFRAGDRADHRQPLGARHMPALADPDLWHLNRQSTARGVAIGLVCGLIPGPLQAAAAALGVSPFALIFRSRDHDVLYQSAHHRAALVMAYQLASGSCRRRDTRRWRCREHVLRSRWRHCVPALGGSMGPSLAVGLPLLAATLAPRASPRAWHWRWHAVRAAPRAAQRRRMNTPPSPGDRRAAQGLDRPPR